MTIWEGFADVASTRNELSDFRSNSIAGMAKAYPQLLTPTPGGVISSIAPPEPRVSVVIGGGSGHYPAFGGMVGPGMADAAVLGDIFASPSAAQVANVARAVDQGCGILLTFGNYTGDVLNFSAAAQMLRADGVDARLLPVTDDIASADLAKWEQRRGIAGDLVVFRIAGAATARGLPLDEVERLARVANHRTRSLGVAYSGCTLPGADEPLFTLPESMMGIGMGIHGEPGLETVPRRPSDEVAALLVDKVLTDLQLSGLTPELVIPIVNGLGALSADELFVAYGAVERSLAARGIEVSNALVGTFCSSFDMSGFSVTLFVPDDELLALWSEPLETPSLRIGTVDHTGTSRRVAITEERKPEVAELLPVSEVSAARASQVSVALAAVAEELARLEPELGRIDAVAGDGDHGIGMARGSAAAVTAAAQAAREGHGAAATLAAAARGWADRAGGTSGAIWGAMLSTATRALTAEKILTTTDIAKIATEVANEVRAMGGAEVGDKTIVDALVPFADSLQDSAASGLPLAESWRLAGTAAQVASDGTRSMAARRGRARTHGAASEGTPDPGCVSFAAVVATIGDALTSNSDRKAQA
ncbi:MAG: dihydroxyacetone kinase family protein [Mycobacterium sp.]